MNYLRIFRIRAYLKFLWQSTNHHGVHSPFVYQLVTQCFYDYRPYSAYDRLKVQRNDLLKALEKSNLDEKHREIRVMPGSPVISLKHARLLNRLVRYLQVQRALEVGTSFGFGAAAMATDNKTAVSSVEDCSIAAEISRENFNAWGLHQVQAFASDLFQVLENLPPEEKQVFDMVYVNGNQKPETILDYFEKLLSFVHNESVFIIADIHSSPEAEVSWETLQKHPEVRVSIDTYKWGLIFLRREQVKEHFVIRI